MSLQQIFPPLFSFLFTLLGIKLMLRFFPKWSLLDRPHEYGIHRKPIPYSGGIIFFIVFLVSTFLFVDITKPLAGVILGAFLITVVSFIDDRKRLSPWLRLFVQLLTAFIVILAGVKIQMLSHPFAYDLPLRLDTITFTFFGQHIWLLSGLLITGWLVLMMNVMNWLDGIPGLASGISTIAQISLFILSTRQFHIVDQSALITLSSVLAAATLAFLFFDFYPPKILMGDTGSMFLGFMLGSLSILAGGKMATALLIMGFPVVDAVFVVLRRIVSGKSPIRGDLSHLHHRMLQVGLSERKALLLNFGVCILFAAIALFLHATFDKFIAFMGLLILMVFIGFFLFFRSRMIDKIRNNS